MSAPHTPAPHGTRAKRGRPSRIDRLPTPIKARLDEMLRGGTTQREILKRLEGPLGEIGERPLSAAGLNRYASRMAEVGADLRELNAIADAWTSKLGDEPTGNVGALTIEVLRSLAFKATMRARKTDLESDEGIDTGQIGELALALQRLERSANLNLARERELRKAVAARAAEQAAESAEVAAREAGHALPAEVLERIRRDVYGIHDAV